MIKKVLTIIGARPQFIKSALVSQAFKKTEGNLQEYTLHTGQHFEPKLSDIFFRDLDLPTPSKQLQIANHGRVGAQLGLMISHIEDYCLELKPDAVLVYGDTTSTLAGALVANKLEIPLAHVEAGLRSYSKIMPEETNRVLTDYMSNLLFAPTRLAVENLQKENRSHGVYFSGDVMVDLLHHSQKHILSQMPAPQIIEQTPVFSVLTLHRKENTQDSQNILTLFKTLSKSKTPFIFPIHPRTRNFLKENQIQVPKQVVICEPLGYFEMLKLISLARSVWTDSGGLQKEAVVLQKKCFTLRSETEWLETMFNRCNELVGFNESELERALHETETLLGNIVFPTGQFYGNGNASEIIVDHIKLHLNA